MEGSESGVVVPSVLEAETWVKLCNFPDEFLTADDISFIVASFGSVVGTDEDTYEKMENHHRPPKLRRKLHSHITFVTIFVRVSVTKPLPSRVAVGSKNGREFIIRLDFDPTPKVCLLCQGAGHFDFECCGTDKESVEIITEAGVGFDGFCADLHGEQGAATSDGLETFSDSFDDDPLVGIELAADHLATVGDSIATDLQAMILADPCIVDEQLSGVFHKWRDFTDDQGLSEDGSGTGVGLLDVEVQDFSPVVEADLVENFLIIEQLFSVVNNPRKHHKWRDKSVVLGLWCVTLDEQGMSSFGKLDLLQMLSRLVWNLAATYYEQVCFKIHHKWRDKGYGSVLGWVGSF